MNSPSTNIGNNNKENVWDGLVEETQHDSDIVILTKKSSTKFNNLDDTSITQPSLQQSFAKFLETKKLERKLNKQLLLNRQNLTRNQQYKDQLRQKFIDCAKGYIGIPYAKKYQPEDAPEYPLYLDCCGLVRQVLKDLQSDFGFLIGKWNQAYQYDTLPIRYNDINQMKPGDLVFYSGEYTSKR